MLGPESLSQSGPHWLSLPRMQWPSSRTFAKEEFPDNEWKIPIRIPLLAAQNTSLRYPIVVKTLMTCQDYYYALNKVTKNLLNICPKLVSQISNHALLLLTLKLPLGLGYYYLGTLYQKLICHYLRASWKALKVF